VSFVAPATTDLYPLSLHDALPIWAEVIRLLPLEVVEGEEPPAPDELLPLYEFEPSPQEVLDVLLPRYVENRIYHCMLQAAASERSEEHTSELQSRENLVCRLLLEK